jgi:hemerythrin-like domain-containing protein
MGFYLFEGLFNEVHFWVSMPESEHNFRRDEMREYQVTLTMTRNDDEWTSTDITNEMVSWLDDLGFEIQSSRVTDMGTRDEE